jgi:hypothetical protein
LKATVVDDAVQARMVRPVAANRPVVAASAAAPQKTPVIAIDEDEVAGDVGAVDRHPVRDHILRIADAN